MLCKWWNRSAHDNDETLQLIAECFSWKNKMLKNPSNDDRRKRWVWVAGCFFLPLMPTSSSDLEGEAKQFFFYTMLGSFSPPLVAGLMMTIPSSSSALHRAHVEIRRDGPAAKMWRMETSGRERKRARARDGGKREAEMLEKSHQTRINFSRLWLVESRVSFWTEQSPIIFNLHRKYLPPSNPPELLGRVKRRKRQAATAAWLGWWGSKVSKMKEWKVFEWHKNGGGGRRKKGMNERSSSHSPQLWFCCFYENLKFWAEKEKGRKKVRNDDIIWLERRNSHLLHLYISGNVLGFFLVTFLFDWKWNIDYISFARQKINRFNYLIFPHTLSLSSHPPVHSIFPQASGNDSILEIGFFLVHFVFCSIIVSFVVAHFIMISPSCATENRRYLRNQKHITHNLQLS